jgi:hypothetical protein
MASIAHGDPCVNGLYVPAESAAEQLLVTANARLMARRAQLPPRCVADTREAASAENLPPHLNWGSAALPFRHAIPAPPHTPRLAPEIEPDRKATAACQSAATLIVQPSLLAAMLKAEVVAIGRVYLLCRHLDADGRGWLNVADLRKRLTDRASTLNVCGWRRLRQIIQAGKGLFWERDDRERLWLYSLTRVAAQLGVHHFCGDNVEMSIRSLCGKLGALRGTFYATFHAGRDSSPIARATLRDITGVPERTQRSYDKTQQIERTANYTLTAASDGAETYFRRGRAAFPFIDKTGKQGHVGQAYTAIRLPNSYHATCLMRLPKKQTRLNKRLRQDLVKYGTRGNSSSSVERLYFINGPQAARYFGRSTIYLQDQKQNAVVFWIGLGRK